VAGAAFAFAWTPCVGPTLGAILTAASAKGTVGQGALLLACYSAGLAVPFMLTAVAFNRATAASRWLRDRWTIVTAVSGIVLIAMGVLLLTGDLTRLNNEAQQALEVLRNRMQPGVLKRRGATPLDDGGVPAHFARIASGRFAHVLLDGLHKSRLAQPGVGHDQHDLPHPLLRLFPTVR
jgi:hypothetical protein